MINRTSLIVSLLATFAVSCTAPNRAAGNGKGPIVWEQWSDAVFERAKGENRFVLLDLGAVWCHWCHVMEETTYRDSTVTGLLARRYIAVRVDQDARPDLANRYEDYGWPATIVFAPDGRELVKLRGYVPPAQMASMLQAVIDDPTPGKSIRPEVKIRAASSAALSDELRKNLVARLKSTYDDKVGGWYGDHKFIDPDVVEYCMTYGDADLRRMARGTLDAARKLIDPAWGGVYQYSTDGDWEHLHFEKIMSYQADDMRVYAQAYAAWHEPADLKSAQEIRRFLKSFLSSPQGAFYTSQDADLVQGEHGGEFFKLDDAARRRLGVPRVDTHVYARENGWAIAGLAALYGATGDKDVLDEAVRAAEWVVANRALDGGGFRHDESDAAGPYLGDTLAMGRACLALHMDTADRKWLTRAEAAADFIGKQFASGAAGFATAAGAGNGPASPRPQVDENVAVARFGALLYAYTGKAEHHAMAERAMKYLAAPEVSAARNWAVGGILLADREVNSEPLHVTIVGAKSDARAAALYREALASPRGYKRVEWFDRWEGPLRRADVEYPDLPVPAAFFCTGTACSSPMKEPAALRAALIKDFAPARP